VREKFQIIGYLVYNSGAVVTFGKLTFFDGYIYNWWNWIIAVAVNGFLSTIWPLYWIIIRPITGLING
jgi:L-lactate permease